MVSLARLLSAASDSSESLRGAARPPEPNTSLTQWLRSCALPPETFSRAFGDEVSPEDQLPPNLRTGVGDAGSHSPHPVQSRPPDHFTIPLDRLLSDFGPEATAPQNMVSLSNALSQLGRPNENAVAKALLMMASRKNRPNSDADADSISLYQLYSLFGPSQSASSFAEAKAALSSKAEVGDWSLGTLVHVVNEIASNSNAPLDWPLVIRSLDCDGLGSVLDLPTFLEIVNAFEAGTNGALIPASCIVEPWQHSESQVAFLSKALEHPAFFDWNCLDAFPGATAEDALSPYARVVLMERLIELDARSLIQLAVSSSSDLTLLSLSCAQPVYNANLQQTVIVNLLTPLIAKFPSTAKTMRQMWHVAPALIEGGVLALWRKDANTAPLIADILMDVNGQPKILDGDMPVEFVMDIALLVYKHQAFPLENWLSKYLAKNGLQAIRSCIKRFAERASVTGPSGISSMSVDGARIVFRVLYTTLAAAAAPQPTLTEHVKRVHGHYSSVNPRISNLVPAEDIGDRTVEIGAAPVQESSTPNTGFSEDIARPVGQTSGLGVIGPDGIELQEPFSSDIEAEANENFHKLYKSQISPEDAVELLRRYKGSDNPRERKVFDCMIHTLFDEYRFVKKYPDKELKITGVLFGSLVQYSLFDGPALELALSFILEALAMGNDNGAGGDADPSKDDGLGRMTKFGLCALDRFRKRLREWPQFCSRILEIPVLKAYAPELLSEVEQAVGLSNGTTSGPVVNQTASAIDVASNGAADPDLSAASPPRQLFGSSDGVAPSVRAFGGSPSISATTTPIKDSQRVQGIRGSPSSDTGFSTSTSLNMEALLAASRQNTDFAIPDEAVQDKIHFIFNNLSRQTVAEKKKEMLKFLRPEHYAFFTYHVVVKRVSNESNHHDLYLIFLDELSPHVPNLFKMVLDRSFESAQILLASERIVTSQSERAILKRLGSWIGLLTLGRNKPVLQRDLDLKELLLDAYSRGRLIAVVPFVAKVLMGSIKSKVFKPENPWLRAILNLMSEIHHVEGLKMNLQLELQVLCNELSIELSDIIPSNLLKDRPQPSRANNPDFTSKRPLNASPARSPLSSSPSPEAAPSFANMQGPTVNEGSSIVSLAPASSGVSSAIAGGNLGAGITSAMPSRLGMGNTDMHAASIGNGTIGNDLVSNLSSILNSASISGGGRNQATSVHSMSGTGPTSISSVPAAASQQPPATPAHPEPTIIPNLAQYITVSPSLPLFQVSPNLKQLLPLAIDRAVKDIIQPVVERSCAIASLTTRELTLKDFAHERDVSKIRKAAQQMVQQLAGSLALVTCKEPLRVSMGNHLRSILAPSVGSDQSLVEQTAQVVCASNLEMGCAIIERAAKEKAFRDLNATIAPTLSGHRPQPSGYASAGGTIPGPEVVRVYDDFSRLPRTQFGEGNRLSFNQTFPSASSSSGFAQQPLTSTTSPSMSAFSQAPATSAPLDPILHRPGGADRIHEPRFVADSASLSAATRTGLSHMVSSELATPTIEPVSQQHPVANSQGSNRSYPSSQSNASGLGGVPHSLPLVMASPSALAAEMTKAVGTSGLGTSSTTTQGVQALPIHSQVTGEDALSTQLVHDSFNVVYADLIAAIANVVAESPSREVSLGDVPPDHEIHQLWTQIPFTVKRSITAEEASMAVAQKVFRRLYEGNSLLYREVHVALLDGLRESSRRLSKELVIWIAYSDEQRKLNRECTLSLLKAGSLLNITSYDEFLSKTIDSGRNVKALDFAAFLIQSAVIEEPLATAAEFALTIETLAKIGRRPNPPVVPSAPRGLLPLVEASRSVSHKAVSTASDSTDGNAQTSHKSQKDHDHGDPAGAREFVASILTKWQEILSSYGSQAGSSESNIMTFLSQVRGKALNTDEARERFCRLAVEMVSNVTSSALNARSGIAGSTSELSSAPYTAVESTVRLICALCRAEPIRNSDSLARGLSILTAFLSALVFGILRSSGSSDVRPYYRMFEGLLAEFSAGVQLLDVTDTAMIIPSPSDELSGTPGIENAGFTKLQALAFVEDKVNGLSSFGRLNLGEFGSAPDETRMNIATTGVLPTFVGALRACVPRAAPNFAFSWLQLMSNKNILPRLLTSRSGSGWALFRQLLVSMLAFLYPHLQSPQSQLSEAIRTLYKGTLRVLLVLLHDFPEFLCDYHFALCDVIPSNCIQLRNLVLAAFPKSMRLPDPLLPELRVEALPEMSMQPRILSNFTTSLVNSGIKGAIDNYLQNATFRASISKLELCPRLKRINAVSGMSEYNIPVINALALYVGHHAMTRVSQSSLPIINGPSTEFLQTLLREMDAEGQYYLFNAIVNQLRFPNSHTHYYSRVLLHLFREASNDSLKEQITRVLVERLIANRPHPWGLLITFVDLIKNPSYNFWNHGFVRCAPQIEHLFEHVARFCIGPALQQNSVAAG